MKRLFTSESVTEGHPDKVCDQISDAVLDAYLEQDPKARVACETAISTGMVLIMGEITADAIVDISEVVRRKLREIGYTDSIYGLDADACSVLIHLDRQSPDIAMGVDAQGAGDQGMMIGYACKETDSLMPMPIDLSHRLARRLTNVRKEGILKYLGPDGKSQVTVEYEDGKPIKVDTVVISSHHLSGITQEQIAKDIKREVIDVVIDSKLIDSQTKIYVNPTGQFIVGGPQADSGLTGRKIIVDTYGGYASHGGGAFSGKDPTKVDRSAAYMARYVAKNIVAADLADKCEIELAYAIGVVDPISVFVETFGTSRYTDEQIAEIIQDTFDLSPIGIIEKLHLREPIYSKTAAYGHFGRTDIDLPWERIDMADLIRRKYL